MKKTGHKPPYVFDLYVYYNEHHAMRGGHDFVEFVVRDDETAEDVLAQIIREHGNDPVSCRPYRYCQTHDTGYRQWYKSMAEEWRQKRTIDISTT